MKDYKIMVFWPDITEQLAPPPRADLRVGVPMYWPDRVRFLVMAAKR